MTQRLTLEERDWSREYVDAFTLNREQRKAFKEICKRQGIEPDYITEFLFKEELIEEQRLAEKAAKPTNVQSLVPEWRRYVDGMASGVAEVVVQLDRRLAKLAADTEKKMQHLLIRLETVDLLAKKRFKDCRELLQAEKKELRAEIARLKGINGFRYRGVWRDGIGYSEGDFVTRAGSLWCCTAQTEGARPGSGSLHWKLAVKRGADGKDAPR